MQHAKPPSTSRGALLLSASNLSKEFDNRVVFAGVGLQIHYGQRLALIGRNGCGKSTLCRLLRDELPPDSGTIWRSKSLRIGYVHQSGHLEEEEEEKDEGAEHEDNEETERKLSESALQSLGRTSGCPEWEIKKLANKLGLDDRLLEAPLSTLSQGQSMRARLVNMFLKRPNLLVLDEPSNYLDTSTLALFERHLRQYRGALLIASHELELLERHCTETLAIEPSGRVILYPGSVSEYERSKEANSKRIVKLQAKVSAKKDHLQGFVDRFRASANHASLVQSRVKVLEKLQIEQEALDEQLGPIVNGGTRATAPKRADGSPSPKIPKLFLPQVQRRHGTALKIQNLVAGYGGNGVCSVNDLTLKHGDRLVILGTNGIGKSTLLKTIAGLLPPVQGSVDWAPTEVKDGIAFVGSASIGHYQNQSVLNAFLSDERVLEYEHVVRILSSFALTHVYHSPVEALSGGERARFFLAQSVLEKNEIYILDEPTNHLDSPSKASLLNALKAFNGTIIVASHDKELIESVATKTARFDSKNTLHVV